MYPRLPAEGILFRELFDSYDSVARNSGTIAGNTTIVGGGAIFDGASGSISYPSHSTIDDIFDGGGTVEVLLNVTSDGEDSFGRVYDKGPVFVFVFGEAGGFTRFGFLMNWSGANGSWASAVGALTLGVLHHLVITYDSDNPANDPIFYLDGAPITVSEAGTPTGTRSTDAADPLYIGNRAADDRTFDGTIHETHFYDRILTAAEVADRFAATTFSEIDSAQAIIHLPLETNYNNGSQVTDNKGSAGGTVTLGDGATASTFPTQGVPHGMNFDGGTDYLGAGFAAAIADIFDGGGTFSCWVRVESDGENSLGHLCHKSDWQIFVKAETDNAVELQLTYAFDGATGAWDTTVPEIFLNQWTHIAVVYDNDDTTNDPIFYIDGRALTVGDGLTEGVTPVGTRLSDSTNTLFLGDTSGHVNSFDGDLWDLRLYNFELTPLQVDYLYRRGRRELSV